MLLNLEEFIQINKMFTLKDMSDLGLSEGDAQRATESLRTSRKTEGSCWQVIISALESSSSRPQSLPRLPVLHFNNF